MELERHIPDAAYIPVDCVKRDARTVVVDLNRAPVPGMRTEAASLLEVIEYIHDVPALLSNLARSYSKLVISYQPREGRSSNAGQMPWINNYSQAEVEELLAAAGFLPTERRNLGEQTIWLATSSVSETMASFTETFTENYNANIQLSPYQAQTIGAAIRSRAPGCRLLVFGVGNDTGLWLALNKDGTTVFIENSKEWAELSRSRHTNIHIEMLPQTDLTVSNSLNLPISALARYPVPASLNREWDVILVDGPPGYSANDPGRALAIAWAHRLARTSTHVFIDDYDRPLERHFANEFFSKDYDRATFIIPASDKASYRRLFWSAGNPCTSKRMRHTVLTVATPDYAARWRFCIDSQMRYCRQHSYEHRVIDPMPSSLNPKWMKIDLALALLEAGNDVFLIDCDAEIDKACPSFVDILGSRPESDILYVVGVSGRPNSGVLLLRGGRGSIASAFLRECLSHRDEPVPEEDFVTAEGENGHIIHVLKKRDYAARAGELDIRWNCSDPARAPEAFVRHYTNFLRLALEKELGGEAKPSVIA